MAGPSSGKAGLSKDQEEINRKVYEASRLCPELITVPNYFAAYVEASGQVMEILGSYDENLQPASLDEAYLDITDYCTQHQMTVEQVVTQLRHEVQEETGLTVSVGIGANKTLAKICSDRNSNPMASTPLLTTDTGLGPAVILSAVNVQTCGDIWEHRHELSLTFGNSLDQLLSAYLGLGSTTVRPNDRRERKSVGRETTFRPTQDLEKMKAELRGCADQVEKDLGRNHFKGRTVTLVAKKDTFQRFTRAKSGTAFWHKADVNHAGTLAEREPIMPAGVPASLPTCLSDIVHAAAEVSHSRASEFHVELFHDVWTCMRLK
ncbi:hypothetical protein V8E36_002303 [Tilletia maclaganii]